MPSLNINNVVRVTRIAVRVWTFMCILVLLDILPVAGHVIATCALAALLACGYHSAIPKMCLRAIIGMFAFSASMLLAYTTGHTNVGVGIGAGGINFALMCAEWTANPTC